MLASFINCCPKKMGIWIAAVPRQLKIGSNTPQKTNRAALMWPSIFLETARKRRLGA
jgi:hypothetical protein